MPSLRRRSLIPSTCVERLLYTACECDVLCINRLNLQLDMKKESITDDKIYECISQLSMTYFQDTSTTSRLILLLDICSYAPIISVIPSYTSSTVNITEITEDTSINIP